jgi:predicted permease
MVVFHVDSLNLRGTTSSDNYETVYSLDMLREFRKQTGLFEGVIARGGMPPVVLGGSTSEYVPVELVSGNYFDVLGVRAAIGRTFLEEDDRAPGERPVAVLPHSTWIQKFGGDPGVIGRQVRLNGNPFTIVGVLAAEFHTAVRGERPAVIVPVSMQRQIFPDLDGAAPDVRWVNIMARLKPGVTARKASASLEGIWRGILEPQIRSRDGKPGDASKFRLELVEGSRGINPLDRQLRTPLLVLMITAGLVLLIACVNIAGLLLARGAARQRDTAIRLSLGASRMRILRHSLTESLLVSAAGGIAGLLTASWMSTALLKLAGRGENSALAWQFDMPVLLFALGVSIGVSLMFGAVPALQAAGGNLALALHNRSLPASHAAWRKVLVGGQLALATLLLFGAGLFARSLQNLMVVDAGFRAGQVMKFDLSPRQAGYDKTRGSQLYADLHARLRALPGVTAAGGTSPGPMSNSNRGSNLTVAGYQPPYGTDASAHVHSTTPGYFATVGIPLLAGRDFTEGDRAGAPEVVIVSEAFSRRYCGGNAIGRKIAWGSGNVVPNVEIVGIAGDIRDDPREGPRPEVYIPYGQERNLQGMTFYVRSSLAGTPLAGGIRESVRSLDPNLPVDNIGPMQEQIDRAVSTDRVLAVLCTVFAGLAVLLTAIGVYGVIAWTVTRRANEIAVRIALGAMPGRVLGLVLGEMLTIGTVGITAGALLALAAGAFAQSRLFGIAGRDPATLAAAAVCSAAAALLATAIPAWRAMRIEPAEALRTD